MKILGLNIGKKWTSTEVLVCTDDKSNQQVFDSYTLQKKRALLALIAVLTVIRDITNDEIKGQCKMLYDSGRMFGISNKTNSD